MKTKIKEFIEATLIIGAKRGSPRMLDHDSAKKLIEQHIDSMTNRLLAIISEEITNSIPDDDAMKSNADTYCTNICTSCGSREECDKLLVGYCLPTIDEHTAFMEGTRLMASHIMNEIADYNTLMEILTEKTDDDGTTPNPIKTQFVYLHLYSAKGHILWEKNGIYKIAFMKYENIAYEMFIEEEFDFIEKMY